MVYNNSDFPTKTTAIWDAIRQQYGRNPEPNRRLYCDSARAVFTYAETQPEGNCRVLSTEDVVQLIEQDHKNVPHYTTALKMDAIRSLSILSKDRKLYFDDHYKGLIGTIKQILVCVYHFINGHGWIDDGDHENSLLKRQINILEEIDTESATIPQPIPPFVPPPPRPASPLARTVTPITTSFLSDDPDSQPKRLDSLAVTPTLPKLVFKPAKKKNKLEMKGGHYATLAQALIKEAQDGECAHALCNLCEALLTNKKLLDFRTIEPEEKGNIFTYEMTIDKVWTGSKSSYPGVEAILKEKILFQLQDNEESKALVFLNETFCMRVGFGFLSVNCNVPPIVFHPTGEIIVESTFVKINLSADSIYKKMESVTWS